VCDPVFFHIVSFKRIRIIQFFALLFTGMPPGLPSSNVGGGHCNAKVEAGEAAGAGGVIKLRPAAAAAALFFSTCH
jgi:hypothetical protein